VADELEAAPSLLDLEPGVHLEKADRAIPGDEELASMSKLLQSHARKLARYRCSKCGFRAREYHWNCPGCSSWDSYPPRRVEELDGA
jgi:lipopolysaccharide biosynthesis regulator YciM